MSFFFCLFHSLFLVSVLKDFPDIPLLTDYSKGFGGKYGVEKDKVDKAALGYEYKGQTEKHQSQKGGFKLWTFKVRTVFFVCCILSYFYLLFLSDYSKGFGGKYGVETEKVDKAALGFDYKGETEKHESQRGEEEKLHHQHQFIGTPTHLTSPSFLLSHWSLSRLFQRIWRKVWCREGESGPSSGGL